jgi:hypothetical protein
MQNVHRAATAPQPDRSTWAQLPEAIRQRLAGYGIHGPVDWRRLPAHRKSSLFGITTVMRSQIQSAAKGAL